MKKLLAMAGIVLVSLPLYPAVLSTSGGGAFSFENAALNFLSGRIYMDLGFLSFGEIGQTGMIKAFDNPHLPLFSLSPETGKPKGDEEGRNGFVFSFEDFSFVYSADERSLAGVFFGNGGFELALMAASGWEKSYGFHEDPARTVCYDTLYGGVVLSWDFFSVRGLVSYAEEIGFRGSASAAVEYKDYSLSLSYGSLIALYEDSPDSTFGISGSFGDDGFLFVFSMNYGSVPVFSEDYLVREAYAAARLDLGSFLLYSEMETSFTRSGKRRHDESFFLDLSYLVLGYGSDGLVLAVDFGHFALGYKDGSPFVSMEYEMEGNGFSFLAEVSTDGGFDLAIRVHL